MEIIDILLRLLAAIMFLLAGVFIWDVADDLSDSKLIITFIRILSLCIIIGGIFVSWR